MRIILIILIIIYNCIDSNILFAEELKIHLSFIETETKADAEKIYSRLREGEQFEKIAQQVSQDQNSNITTGDIGELSWKDLSFDNKKALSGLKQGNFTNIIHKGITYRILYVARIIPSSFAMITKIEKDINEKENTHFILGTVKGKIADKNIEILLCKIKDLDDGKKMIIVDLEFKTETNAQGQFIFKNVPPGKYTLINDVEYLQSRYGRLFFDARSLNSRTWKKYTLTTDDKNIYIISINEDNYSIDLGYIFTSL